MQRQRDAVEWFDLQTQAMFPVGSPITEESIHRMMLKIALQDLRFGWPGCGFANACARGGCREQDLETQKAAKLCFLRTRVVDVCPLGYQG